MIANQKWNRIVEIYNASISAKEDTVHSLWERIFVELFGYSSLNGEIESQRKIQIGSTERIIPDIIIKDSNNDLFVVELNNIIYVLAKAWICNF